MVRTVSKNRSKASVTERAAPAADASLRAALQPRAYAGLRSVAREVRYTAFNRTIVFFAIVCALLYGTWYAGTTALIAVPPPVTGLTFTLASLLFIYLVASVVVRITAKRFVTVLVDSEDVEHRLILTKLYAFLVYLIATAIVLWKLGLSAQNLTIFLGLATTGFAFAIRDILTSYFVWFMLLTKKPFRIGDFISIGDHEGRVQHIGTFYVVIDDTPDTREDHVRVPNKLFLEKPITNYGRDLVTSTVQLPVEPVPEDFSARYARFTGAVHRDVPTAVCSLDVNGERIVAVVEVRSLQTERSFVRDLVIQSFVRVFKAPATKRTKTR